MLALRRSMILLLWAALSALAPAIPAQTAGGQRFAVANTALVDLLQQTGITVSAGQIQLPSGLSASTKSDLQITGAETLSGDRLRVRVSCGSGGECMPFLAIVNLQGAAAVSAGAALSLKFHVESSIRSSGLPTLRAGEHTMLLMEDGHMRILIPVLSIDSGGIGTEIRVSSLDRKQIFRATVLSSEIVRGPLP